MMMAMASSSHCDLNLRVRLSGYGGSERLFVILYTHVLALIEYGGHKYFPQSMAKIEEEVLL
jgi:hypothetical protein